MQLRRVQSVCEDGWLLDALNAIGVGDREMVSVSVTEVRESVLPVSGVQ